MEISIRSLITIYITVFVVAFIMLKIYERNTSKKFEINKINIFKILVMSILCFLNNLFMIFSVRTFFSLILTFILFKIIFKDETKRTIYYTIIISISLYLIELLVSLFLPMSIKNIIILNSSGLYKAIFSFIVNFIQYIILTNNIVVTFFKKIYTFILKDKLYYTLLIITLIISNLWVYIISLNINNKAVNILICLTEVLVIVLFLITLHNNYEKKVLDIKEKQITQNLDLYTKLATEYKELRHNLMNDLLIIKTKMPKKEQDFINEIINKYKTNYDWVNSVTDIPEGLQGLVFLKKNQAELKKIKFNLEYNIDKKVENISNINNNFKLYEVLGILFDNAIEGAETSKDKIINVVFSYDKNNFQISIFNTFNNDIDLDKIGTNNYSTKNRGSGMGLNYIKRQHNKFKINHSIQGNIFITNIIIHSKEKK